MWEEHYRLKEQDELETVLTEGYKKGVKEGMKKMKKNLEKVIQNMISKNIDYQTISEVTGKDIDAIKRIENRIKN